MSWNSKNLKICSKCPLGGARPPFWDPYIEKCLDGHIFGRTPVQIRLWDARNWFQLRSQYVFPFRALMGLGRLAIRGHFISWRLDWSNDYPHLNFLGKKVAIFHADSELGLKNDFGNIPRPLEAILSFKSLIEGVPESTLGSYFVWRAKMRNHYHLETSLEAVRPLLKFEAAWGRSSDLRPPRPPYMVLKWLPLVSGCQIWPRPRMASSNLERPRDFKQPLQPQKGSHEDRDVKILIHVKYELSSPPGT